MASSVPARWASRAILVALLAQPVALAAQRPHQHDPRKPHADFTSSRPGTGEDTARALAVVQRLREAIAPYADVKVAEAAGYRGHPGMEMQTGRGLVHLGDPKHKQDQDSAFDPSRPQALLYRRVPGGELTLAGAMFTAPGSASAEELDARVPLSVAMWHKHVNVCRPRRDAHRTVELRRAATPEECEKAGGRFRSESPRYMVHVMTDAGDDLDRIFPQGRGRHW